VYLEKQQILVDGSTPILGGIHLRLVPASELPLGIWLELAPMQGSGQIFGVYGAQPVRQVQEGIEAWSKK
jgi:hypothetical protein